LLWVLVETRQDSAAGPGLDFRARTECTYAVSVSIDQPPTRWVHFQLRDDDRDPCLAFYEHLRGEVLTWLAAGDQIIIGGDLNAHVLKPTVSLFFSQLGLHNLIFERHSPIGAPTTSARNEQRKILDSFWDTANISVARCGYCHPKAFPLGGHSVVWMDLTYSCALGHYPPTPHTFQARRLRMDRPITVKSYQDRHRLNVLECSLLACQFNLECSLLPGIPLSKAQSLEAECCTTQANAAVCFCYFFLYILFSPLQQFYFWSNLHFFTLHNYPISFIFINRG